MNIELEDVRMNIWWDMSVGVDFLRYWRDERDRGWDDGGGGGGGMIGKFEE